MDRCAVESNRAEAMERIDEAQTRQDVKSQGAQTLAADFVAWESALFDEGDVPAAPRDKVAGGAGADDRDVGHGRAPAVYARVRVDAMPMRPRAQRQRWLAARDAVPASCPAARQRAAAGCPCFRGLPARCASWGTRESPARPRGSLRPTGGPAPPARTACRCWPASP